MTVLGVFAGAASAQSNVTIYGVVDLGIANENNGGTAGSVTRLDSGNLNGSRLGFKGTEDLGGGLSAIFQLENGFSADTGALGQGGLLFGRHAWVGLTGGFGTVKIGRQILPVYDNADIFDPFADALAGDTARMFNYSGNRVDNSLSYAYAANGFKGQITYGLGEVAGNTSGKRTLAGFGSYSNGPVQAVLTYTSINDASGNDSAKTTLLGGNYNFGMLKLFGAYAWNKGLGTLDTRDALIGLSAPVGSAGNFMASYIRKTDKFKSNADANQLAIGYTHELSKRTALYTSISRTANDSLASYNAGAPGGTDRLFNAGIRHKF